MKGLLVFCGAFVAAAAVFAAGMKARNPNPSAGWELVPVVVAAVDIPKGSVLTMEHLSQRALPEQFFTAAYVTPERASLTIGKKVVIPLLEGEALSWAAFADVSRHTATRDCALAIKPALDELASTSLAQTVDQLRAGAVLPPASDIPPPVIDAQGFVEVVTAVHDLAPGVIRDPDVKVTKIPARFATPSWVPGSERTNIVGVRLLVAVQARDGVWWQMLDDASHPATAAGCMGAVEGAQAAKVKAVADVQAAKWFDEHPTREAP